MKISIPERQIFRPASASLPLTPLNTAGIEAEARANFARSIGDQVNLISKRIAQARQAADTERYVLDAETQINDWYVQRSTQKGQYQDLVKETNQQFDDFNQALYDTIEDPVTRQMISTRMAGVRQRYHSQAAKDARSQEIRYTQESTEGSLESARRLIVAEPNAERRNSLVANARANIQAQVDAGIYSDVEGDALFQDFLGETQNEFYERFLRNDPAGAIDSLASDDYIPGMSESERNVLLRQARAEQTRQRKEMELNQAAEDAAIAKDRALMASELELAVERGQVFEAEVQEAFANDIITGSKRTQLMKQIDTQRQEAAERTERTALISTTLQTGQPLDSKNTDHVKAVDEFYNGLGGQDMLASPEGRTMATNLVRQTGIIPSDMRSFIRVQARAGNQAAAEMIERLNEDAPAVLRDLPQSEIAFGLQAAELSKAGMEPDQAMNLARKNVYQLEESEREVLSNQYQPERKNNLSALNGYIDDDFDGWFTSQPEAPAALQGEFENLTESYYLQTRDIGMARKLAWSDLKRVWAVTEINGGRHLMKYAPEAFYGVGDNDWMQTQLQSDVATLGVTDPVKVVADNQTAREKVPSYAVLRVREDGLTEPVLNENNQPIRWRPDFASSEAGRKAAKEREDAVKSARKRAQQLREHQVMGGQPASFEERVNTLSRLSIAAGGNH